MSDLSRTPERRARRYELIPGEIISGRVVRLPAAGVYHGNRLFVETAGGYLAVPATAKAGWTLLERALAQQQVDVGDVISITYAGMRPTIDDERTYRDVRLEIVARAESEAAA